MLIIIIFSSKNVKGWGYATHTQVSENAIELLPVDIKGLFQDNIADIKAKSTEPDNAKDWDKAEYARHFDNSDIEHKNRDIPSGSADYELGVISWALENSTRDLARAFYFNDLEKIIHYAGYVTHYATDATQPFHTTGNFNGQLTGNGGIHSTFEINLIESHFVESFSNVTFSDLQIIDAYNETEKIISSRLKEVDKIIEIDDLARSTATSQAEYLSILWEGTKDIIKESVNIAIQHTANLWYTAYSMSLDNSTNWLPFPNPTVEETSSIQESSTVSSNFISLGLFVCPIITLTILRKNDLRKIIKF